MTTHNNSKLGTTSGVFLPSLLTIVGAIMFLRLGWIIQHGGLMQSIWIVITVFAISLITGCCLSSIATDKKIQNDGIYHILSRSLGLPMGSTICIMMTLALIFSAALQIIGISESLLDISKASNFLHIAPSAASYRIIGSILLLPVFALVMISRKSTFIQKFKYVVGLTIILATISVIAGLFTKEDIHPLVPSTGTASDGHSWIYIFSIFFPALSGFATGLANSTGLKNAKKSIPRGIIFAIITSTVIYLSVIILLAYEVKSDILKTTNYLPSISWNATITFICCWISLVFIAINALTIGSDIILSMARDKVLPEFFAHSSDHSDKPVIHIAIIFVLTECAILIGDFNTLARITSFFLLVSYALINLALMLEKWTNPDFRPTFNVSKYIGLIGLFICSIALYDINRYGMLGTVIAVILLYFFIRRKKLLLEYDDIWQNVLLAITKTSISRINKRKLENRTWQPNIIVFSGDKDQRPYLVDFGKWIAGKHGFVSNFNITTSKEKKNAYKNSRRDSNLIENKIFPSNDIYSGIETVASVYGFAGIEPNTVLLGFNSTAKNRERYITLLANISKLDKNILLIHYNEDNGYGNKKNFDVWVTPGERDSLFALNVIKLISNSTEWSQCSLRIKVVNSNNSSYNLVYNKVEEIMAQLRISGEILIINNELEDKPVKDLIASHSTDADVIFIAVPPNGNYNEKYDYMSNLSQIDKTIIFVKASTEFQSIGNLDIITKQLLQPEQTTITEQDVELQLPIRQEAASFFVDLDKQVQTAIDKSLNNRFDLISKYFKTNIEYILQTVKNNYVQTNSPGRFRHIAHISGKTIKQKFVEFIKNILPEIHNLILGSSRDFLNEMSTICASVPKTFTVFYEENLSYPSNNDTHDIIKFKKKLARYFKHNREGFYPYEVKIDKFITNRLDAMYNEMMTKAFDQFKDYCLSYYFNVNNIINSIDDANAIINGSCNLEGFNFDEAVENIYSHIETSNDKNNKTVNEIKNTLKAIKNKYFDEIRNYFDVLNFGEIKVKSNAVNCNSCSDAVTDKFDSLSTILPALFNRLVLNADLTIFKIKLKSYCSETLSIITDFINNKVIPFHEAFISEIKENKNLELVETSSEYDMKSDMFSHLSEINDKINKSILRFPSEITILDNQAVACLGDENIHSVHSSNFAASRLLDNSVLYYYSNNLKKQLNLLSSKVDISLDKHKDIITQLSFTNEDNEEQKDAIILNIYNLIIDLKKSLNETCHEIQSTETITDEQLQIEQFIDSSHNLHNIISTNINDKKKETILSLREKISVSFHKTLSKIFYRQNSSLKFAKNLQQRNSDNELLKLYINATNKISLKPEVDQTLPYSYKQLFINNQQYNKELWVGRVRETNDFNVLLSQYNSLKAGAIMVTGGIGSGKTFFSYHVAKTAFPDQQIFTIKSVTGGSASVSKFETSFLRAIEMQNISLFKAIREIPKGSIFILDNIEQWWHRSDKGNDVIKLIIDLVNKYSENYLFILNSNTEGLNALQLTTNIRDIIIGTVHLLPFSAEEIEAIITRRHKAGNMHICIDNKNEKLLRPWHYAQLFLQYDKLTAGNIKSALSTWLACIDKVENDTIFIHHPEAPNSLPFNELTKQQIIFLVQFIIHNNMSYERMQAIYNRPISSLKQDVNVLIRLRLLEKKSENVIGINNILYPFIIEELNNIEMI